MCDGTYFTNILHTFFETKYIPELSKDSNMYCHYIMCVSDIPVQVPLTYLKMVSMDAETHQSEK
jgi:hypothetical protein